MSSRNKLDQLKLAFGHAMASGDAYARGQSNLTGLFIGVMVATIMGVGVVIPVVNDILAESNVSGTTALILGLIPLFIGVMILVSLASPLMRRM